MHLEFTKKSRSKVLAAITISIMIVFVLRLFWLQVIRHDYYVTRANNEQMKQFELPAKRGEIYAMDKGEPTKVVMNETVYTVYIDPKVVQDKPKIIETIKNIAGGNTRAGFEKMFEDKSSRYKIVATNVTRRQAEMIKKEQLFGLGFQPGSRRVYPEGQLAAQVLGFVNNEGDGQYGVEGAVNQRLKGRDGMLRTVTDVRDVPLTVGGNNIRRPAKDGENIVLTIDRNIQAHAEKALADGMKRTGAKYASALIMDPQTGKVLAMSNLPTYKPENFSKVEDAAVFNNRTITEPYEVGSVAKAFTVATGIDKGVIRPDSTYNNTDSIQVGDKKIVNASKGQTGVVTMQHALNWSLNTGMVTIAQRLGNGNQITQNARNTMYEYLHDRYRLGKKTGIELVGEAAGTIVPADTLEGNAVRYSNMSFGQGMDLTMLQTAAGFSSLINGGDYYTPSVIAGTADDDMNVKPAKQKPVYPQIIQQSTSEKVREMVHIARTKFYAGNDRPGYYIGGKTGTSETLENGKYIDNQTIGTYLGFGGNDTSMPSYVIMVKVAGKGMNLEGGKHAMPIFTDISNWMLEYLKLSPKE